MQRIALGHAASVAPGRRHGVVAGFEIARRRKASVVAFGATIPENHQTFARAGAAGAAAAVVWGLLEPLDRRLLRCDYSDIAILGKAVTRGPAWRPVGFAIHAANGAAFGLVFEEVRRRTRLSARPLALGMALAEHVALYPLGWFVERYHPARGEPGIPPLLRNPRAFAQATWRHAVFGVVLGRLARRV
jgi:hypothetical protein